MESHKVVDFHLRPTKLLETWHSQTQGTQNMANFTPDQATKAYLNMVRIWKGVERKFSAEINQPAKMQVNQWQAYFLVA